MHEIFIKQKGKEILSISFLSKQIFKHRNIKVHEEIFNFGILQNLQRDRKDKYHIEHMHIINLM